MKNEFGPILKNAFIILTTMLVIYVLFRMAPYLLVFGAVAFAYFKISGKLKGRKEEKERIRVEEIRAEEDSVKSKFDFSNKQVVDVEYSEVKNN
ncbi:MAG: hypothetical protein AB9844_12460 [Clostridiaceae bacterium]